MDILTIGNISLEEEKLLVVKAQSGDPSSLEALVKLHETWVFNIVLRMVGDFHEAEDITQDILLKAFMKIKTFQGNSRFRTWLYRLTVNYVLNMKETNSEKLHNKYYKTPYSDEDVNDFLNCDVLDPNTIPNDLSLLAGEVMVKCMLGMLLCLNRKYRLVFILGGILNVNGKVGSEILEISEDNYRQILSRARAKVYNFLNDRCSLVNPGKPCTCERCIPSNIKTAYIDPLKIVFNTKDGKAIREIITDTGNRVNNIRYEQCAELYRKHPLQESPDFVNKVIEILRSKDVQHFLNTAT